MQKPFFLLNIEKLINQIWRKFFLKKRKYKRELSNGLFSIRTSLNEFPIALRLKDISRGGAFIRSLNLPKLNQKITYTIMLDNCSVSHSGIARVIWCCDVSNREERGFGIQFENELLEEILNSLIKKK